MILRSVTKHVRDQNWFAVGLDFLIVVVGVFIGIQVANWNEARREQNLERSYLENLREDFRTSQSELETKAEALVEIIEAMRTLLEQDAESSRSVDELNDLFRRIQWMPTFNWTSRTYDNLIGAGELRLIDDSEIANSLAFFDTRVRLIEMVQATHEQELVETFQPWIIENMDYVAVHHDRLDGEFTLPEPRNPDRIVELIDDREFRNVLVQKWMISVDLLDQNRGLQAQASRLLELLGNELGQADEAAAE
ncbi:MAG: DUF6090 family protein [Wenzhouxiangellaceae bacterium]|nr:DUF6090 family protein [Wenzhouxiangellaceae bacterium]